MAEILTREDFVKKYLPYIQNVTEGTGIFPGTLMAQAVIESQGKVNGKWMVGGSRLSQRANNFFGIKASKDWKGRIFNIDTGEYTKEGVYYIQTGAAFRAYDSVRDSIADYVKFLKANPRYEKAGVFSAKSVKEQAEALKRAGYATALNYAQTIQSVYDGLKGYASGVLDVVKKNKGKTILAVLGLGALVTGIIIYTKNR